MKNIKDNSYDFEDLASLLYIKYLIDPNKKYEKMRHVVVDEAQDLGEFNFLKHFYNLLIFQSYPSQKYFLIYFFQLLS